MYSFEQICIFFMIYAIVGWCIEVIYATTKTGKFVNRGFLNGPLCPIYGVGVTIVVLILTPLQDNIFLLYLGSVILASALEFLTGFVLEKIFNKKWWDYSDEPFNIMSYVCLRFSLLWGAACVFVMKVTQPLVLKLISVTPELVSQIILIIFFALFIADQAITIGALCKIHMQLRLATDIDILLNKIAETVGSKLSDDTLKGMKDLSAQKERIDTRYERIVAKAKARYGDDYKQAAERLNFVHKRLEKAFPALELHRITGIGERIASIKKELEKRNTDNR